MRIYRMTATFGKLEHETLTLEPGLNVITAPNEWGKSTWCAFLVAMLYGLDTRTKSTKTTLAAKERFAPWSGSPMAGRIDLNWNGRDITIERSTKCRVPMGEFRAYETDSGLPVEELNAYNCGQVLLGVEQSVFRRAGFIRQAELPVTQDDALRRRLNALVTTGDESGAADKLADSLKDLKNRCRYNRTGLLPQAEQERDALVQKLEELEDLEDQTSKLRGQLAEIKLWLEQLNNHRQALAYEQAQAIASRVEQAELARDEARKELQEAEAICADLPRRENAEEGLREIRIFREQWNAAQGEAQSMPQAPVEPRQEGPFAGMSAAEARQAAMLDGKLYASLTTGKTAVLLMVMGIFGLLAAGLLGFLRVWLFAGIAGVTALLALGWGVYESISEKKQAEVLVKKYGSRDYQHWPDSIRGYEALVRQYQAEKADYEERKSNLEARLADLAQRREALCGDYEPDEVLDYWQEVLAAWDALFNAQREARRSQSHFETISAMVKPVEKPGAPDHLTQTEEETASLLAECASEEQHLQNRLGRYQGRMTALGDKGELQAELDRKNKRIAKLEDTYTALTIAQETLEQARTELQRRFAPRITRRAQELLSAMTGGRYHSLTMGVDFSLQAGAGEEDVLHEAIWRSDGTMDQLYLALRLAVAEELTPEAPLILDDAMVRFDDERLAAAVKLLGELAENKQIICFTCQNREQNLVK